MGEYKPYLVTAILLECDRRRYEVAIKALTNSQAVSVGKRQLIDTCDLITRPCSGGYSGKIHWSAKRITDEDYEGCTMENN